MILLALTCVSHPVYAQQIKIEGPVYGDDLSGCNLLLDDIHTDTTYLLYYGDSDLYQSRWAVVWGNVENFTTICEQGIPFAVTDYTVKPYCNDCNSCTNDTYNSTTKQCEYTLIDPPCTNDGTEIVVVDLTNLVGTYGFWESTIREAEIDLDFTPFKVECMNIEWSGVVQLSKVDCTGTPDKYGYGGSLQASFNVNSYRWYIFGVDKGEALTNVPFHQTDVITGERLDFLVDQNTKIHVVFRPVLQKCAVISQPGAVLDSVNLTLAIHRMHDYNRDAKVDLDDATIFSDCFIGPDHSYKSNCQYFDSDRDMDVDLFDAASFQREFTGS